MVTSITSFTLISHYKQIHLSIPKYMRPTMNQSYIIMFYKHCSNVYVVDFITQVIALVWWTLWNPCDMIWVVKRNHWWSLSWNYRVPTHCMSIIKRLMWALPSHALSFIKVWINPSRHFSTTFGPPAALRNLLVHLAACTVC